MKEGERDKKEERERGRARRKSARRFTADIVE